MYFDTTSLGISKLSMISQSGPLWHGQSSRLLLSLHLQWDLPGSSAQCGNWASLVSLERFYHILYAFFDKTSFYPLIGTYLGDYFGILMASLYVRIACSHLNRCCRQMHRTKRSKAFHSTRRAIQCTGGARSCSLRPRYGKLRGPRAFLTNNFRHSHFAIRYERVAGLILTALVFVLYNLALRFEG